MEVIPVLDVMAGKVVRAVAGRRHEYRPVDSRLCRDAEPLAVAQVLRTTFGFERLYVADLDAIGGKRPAFDILRSLVEADFQVAVDPGIRTADDVDAFQGYDLARVIIGLETITSPVELGRAVDILGRDRLAFSLDLKNGQPIGAHAGQFGRGPEQIVRKIIELGIEHLILIDLAHVGMGTGVGTDATARHIRRSSAAVHLTLGGGVGGLDDLRRLADLGADAVLVATALHDGRLDADDVRLASALAVAEKAKGTRVPPTREL